MTSETKYLGAENVQDHMSGECAYPIVAKCQNQKKPGVKDVPKSISEDGNMWANYPDIDLGFQSS